MSERIAVFAYGSLVEPASAGATFGRPMGQVLRADLHGWKRRYSQARDNLSCEKTFELLDGHRPRWILGLNVEQGEDDAGPVNGVLIKLSTAELARLDLREIRYDRVDVTELVAGDAAAGFDRILTYTAKAGNLAQEAPEDAFVLDTYVRCVEGAFKAMGPSHLATFLATTGRCPVDVAEGRLVVDQIPRGNPRAW